MIAGVLGRRDKTVVVYPREAPSIRYEGCIARELTCCVAALSGSQKDPRQASQVGKVGMHGMYVCTVCTVYRPACLNTGQDYTILF